MNQGERRRYLLNYLIKGLPQDKRMNIPFDSQEQKTLLRALVNLRPASGVPEDVLRVQNEYLRQEISDAGIIDLFDIKPIKKNIYLWQGDITTLSCGAIVNAANSTLTGCYYPNHQCIDNCIHTFAGMQLRNRCQAIMDTQGSEEPVGQAKITPSYNLPCDYIIHTVGPRISMRVRHKDEEELASCYKSCLELADSKGIDSIAFCCISTGEFSFPNELAAKIAVTTVNEYLQTTGSEIKVIFNVFKDEDKEIYKKLLS